MSGYGDLVLRYSLKTIRPSASVRKSQPTSFKPSRKQAMLPPTDSVARLLRANWESSLTLQSIAYQPTANTDAVGRTGDNPDKTSG